MTILFCNLAFETTNPIPMKMKQTLFKSMFVVLFFTLPTLMVAQGTITGNVTAVSDGLPLPAVNVVVKGTTVGTTTDFDGNYEITVDDFPVTLVFSSLGYSEKEIEVTEAGAVDSTLEQAATGLDEVVVTGLATSIKRTNAANAVASISAEALVGTTPPPTVDGALYGKFAGADVSANSGAPGGGISIRLRGATSITGNTQPLYIVDGVYVDNSAIPAGLNFVSSAAAGGSASNQDNPTNRIADLNAYDIGNIEILKGASAAAIYGSRASAGVVIITTKRGKAGKTKFNFSQSIGYVSAINLLGTRNYTEQTVSEAFGDAAVPLFTAARNSGRLVDYENELYGEKGLLRNTNLSVSGGTDDTTFYASVSNINENGIVRNTGYEKTSLRLNVDNNATDFLKLGFNAGYTNSRSDRGFFNNDNSGTTIGVSLTGTRPFDNLFPNAAGVYPDNPNGSSNILQTRDLVTNSEEVNRLIMGANADLSIYRNDNSNLKLVLRGGLDTYSLETLALFPKELQFQKPENGGLNGVSLQGNTVLKNYNLSGFLVHSYYTEKNTNFRTQVGLTREFFDRNTNLITASTLVASETNVDQAANTGVDQTRRKQEDSGFFVQEEVNFDDKLILTAGVRGDKSSNNGDANKLFYYPKASIAVNLHRFGIGGDDSFLNQLKLRAAYGESGNFPLNGSLFTSFGTFSTEGLLGTSLRGVRGDGDLEPERQKEFEAGFDIGFLKNRLLMDFTYYVKTVDNLLLQPSLEPSTGFGSQFTNAGSLRNKGVEFAIQGIIADSENFKWNSSVNFFANTAEITELTVPAFNVGAFGATLGTFRIEEGASPTQLVGIGPDPGENGLQVFGNSAPDFTAALNNNIRWKNLELSFLWQWKKGGDNVNLTALLTDLNGTSADYDAMGLDPSGELANGPFRLSNLGVSAEPFIEDASYVRLREAGLYYNFPEKIMDTALKGIIDRIKIGVSGTNLVNIFDYNSYDPEVSNFGSNGIFTGVEVTPFPSSKRILFHLQVDF